MEKFAPPPTRAAGLPERAAREVTTGERRKAWWGAKGKKWGDKAQVWSDSIGGRVNSFAENRLGSEAFYPVTGDMPREMDKVARILRMFTVDGIVTTDKKSKRKVLRKIPPSVIKKAKGLAIFTSMRSGIAPFGGAGGAGLVMARLPDGSWSAPASITPNNLSAGFLLGVDIYDCVLVINSQRALDSFGTHKFTLGTEIAVAAGPWGAGAAMEAGKERSPVFSYVKSRGLYAGVEVVGQVFVERFDENALQYHWPGVKARDILAGKVEVPREAAALRSALDDAESGRAQAQLYGGALEVAVDKAGIPLGALESPEMDLVLDEGEVLKLPPTPDMTDGHEGESDYETERIIRRSGINPPSLPPRTRPVSRSSTASGRSAASASASSSRAVPPPLPPRAGEAPPDYFAAEEIQYDPPEGPPPPIPTRAANHTLTSELESLSLDETAHLPTLSPTSPASPNLITPVHAAPGTPELRAMGAPEDMTPGERLEWAQACAQRADRAVVAEEKLSEVDLEEVAVEDVKDVYVDVKDLAKDVEDVKVEKAEEVNVAEEVLESKVPEIQSKPKAKEETKTDVVAEQSL